MRGDCWSRPELDNNSDMRPVCGCGDMRPGGVEWLSRRHGDTLLSLLTAHYLSGTRAPHTFPGQFRNAMCHIPSSVSMPTLQYIGSSGSFHPRETLRLSQDLYYRWSHLTETPPRQGSFSFYLIILSGKNLFIINKCLPMQVGSSRRGRWVCLIRYWRCYRSSVCDTHSWNDGIARQLFTVTAVALIVGPGTKNPAKCVRTVRSN